MINIKIQIKNINNQDHLFIEGALNVSLKDIDFIELNAHEMHLKNAVCIHTKSDDHNWLFMNQHADALREFIVNSDFKIKFK